MKYIGEFAYTNSPILKSSKSLFRKSGELKSVPAERLLSNNSAIFREAPSIEFSSRPNNSVCNLPYKAIEYAEKILKDNPDILKLVLEDIKDGINNKIG